MVLTDPRFTLKTWFDPGSGATKVTGANIMFDSDVDDVEDTVATYEAQYELPETLLSHLFLTVPRDIVFLIVKFGEDPVTSSSGPFAYTHHLGVQPVVLDKFNVGGVPSLYGTVLLWKALCEVRRIIRENMVGSVRTVANETAKSERLGAMLLYGDIVKVDVLSIVSAYS